MIMRFVVLCGLVFAATLAACGGGAPPPAQPSNTPRPTIPRSELPPELQPLVPRHGVLVAGGGEKSPAWRIIVDTDRKTIYTGSAEPNTPIAGAMAQERTRELTPPNERHLMQLSADAWVERVPAQAPDPVVGYEEVLIIADAEEVFFLHERAPIKRPLAVKAIQAIRAAGAL